jgi:VWFA-related protein
MVLLLLWSGSVVLPQTAPPPEATFAVGARTVRVPVSVVDSRGQPVLGLSGEDFRVAEDGKRQKVTLFSRERRPLRIALALDVSRSMDDKIRQVEEALLHFVALLEPADEVTAITFADEVQVVQELTSDRERLAAVLDRLEPAGGTALYDAAFVAIERVARGPAEGKAVVLVTDGVDTSSTHAFKDLRELARRAEVPVFSIGLDGGGEGDSLHLYGRPEPGTVRPGWPTGGGGGVFPGAGGRGWPGGGGPGRGRVLRGRSAASFDDHPLLELAAETGGRAQVVKGIERHASSGLEEASGRDRLKQAVEAIAVILRHRYLLGYEPPEGKSGWRSIRVDVERPDSTARARKGYYGG